MIKTNLKYQVQQYAPVIALTAVLFAAFSVYLFLRRGYYDLYIINKIFAGVSVVLFGIVLLIGPLSRMFSFPDRFVQYRKEFGIVAFFLAIFHSAVSFFFLPNKFPMSRFFSSGLYPFIFGLAATIIFIAIFVISNDRATNAIGREKWWRLQYWGARISFVLIFLHVFIMKWNGWASWYKIGGGKELARPDWPGAGLLVGWFMVFVVFVRLAEFISPKLGKIAWYLTVIGLPIIYILTFLRGAQFVI